MKPKERTGAGLVVALVGAFVGLIGVFYAFLHAYGPMMAVELAAGRPDEALIVKYVIPFLSDLGLVGGAMWAVAAYGFARKERWAWTVAITANVISLQTGFFSMIPAMSRGLFPLFLIVFVPNLLTYILLLTYVRHVDGRIVALSFLSGMTYVLVFMNGVASTDKLILSGRPLFVAVQRINWVASIGWGVFTVALLLRKRWALPVGLAAGLLTLVAGVPLAVVTTVEAGRFSMFSPAPLFALLLLILLFLLPAGRKWMDAWLESPQHRTQIVGG